MRFAQIEKDFVVNVIVANPEQKEELEEALHCELEDASPYNLQTGDMRVGGHWTRNVEGEQVQLTERPTYTALENKIAVTNAAAQIALSGVRMTQPVAQIGNLVDAVSEWEAGKSYEAGELFSYEGSLGFARQSVTAQAHQPPFSAGMEAIYGVRPPADAEGVYPYVYNMRVEPGMLVREMNKVYRCIQQSDPLLYPPSQVPALFEEV